MDTEEDIVLIKDNVPVEPTVDPLEVDEYNFNLNTKVACSSNGNENVINLDSSDDENCSYSQNQEFITNEKDNAPKIVVQNLTVLHDALQPSLQQNFHTSPSQNDVIDLDADDSDPLAPLKSIINPKQNIRKSISVKNSRATFTVLQNNTDVPKVNSSKQILGNVKIDGHTKTQTKFKINRQNNKSVKMLNTKKRMACSDTVKKRIIALTDSGSKLAENNSNSLTRARTTDRSSKNRPSSEITEKSSYPIISRVQTTIKSFEPSNNKSGSKIAENSSNLQLKSVETTEKSPDFSHNKPFIISSSIKPAEVPENKNLTYLGKIIRIPGQPSLIEDSSGLVFRADNTFSNLNNCDKGSLENELNLYRNFLSQKAKITKNPGQDWPSPTQSKNVSIVDAASVILPESSISDTRNVQSKKAFLSKNIDGQSKKQLRMDNLRGNDNISSKKLKSVQSTHQNIKEVTPRITPYQSKEAGSTVFDLNLNINDTGSSVDTRPINTISQSNNSLPNDSTGGYNFALGLVLNVNDANKPNNSYQTATSNQFSSLNNVALDVSFNVNNKEKPATITSEQELQDPSFVERVVLHNAANNTSNQMYYCSICLFKTFDVALIKSHRCLHLLNTNFENPEKILTNKNEEPKKTFLPHCTVGDPHFCNLCSFKTFDFELMKTHKCSYISSGTPHYCNLCSFRTYDCLLTQSHNCLLYSPRKPHRCNLCSFKTFDFELMKLHKCSNNSSENNVLNVDQQDILGEKSSTEQSSQMKIYCCVACSFQTSDFEVINSHSCPSVNTVLPNTVNTSFESSNLQNRKSFQDVFEETGRQQEKTLKDIYECGTCSFQTDYLQNLKSHECHAVHKKEVVTTARKLTKIIPDKSETENQQEKWYCCISCPFKTASFEIVQAHRCRKKVQKQQIRIKKRVQDILNDLETPSVKCEICDQEFKTKYLFFQHLRRTHFDVRKKYGCNLCTLTFDIFEGLKVHFQIIHHDDMSKLKIREIYTCNSDSCEFHSETLLDFKSHFDEHVKFMHTLLEQLQGDDLDESQDTGEEFLYECKLCCRKTNSIFYWLHHTCMEKKAWVPEVQVFNKEFMKIREEAPPKRPYKRRRTKLAENMCYYCKLEISDEILKCNNSDCKQLYHLKCVNTFARCVIPDTVDRLSNWFCTECNDKNMESSPVTRDEINDMNWCLTFADRECVKEVKKQKIIASEINKIKEEKLRMKEEFQQIKKFIIECESAKINNSVVKSVCTVVESFINAGIDSND